MVSAVGLNVGIAMAILMTGIAAMLLFVSLVSYARLRAGKLLVVGGAFLILAIKGGLAIYRGVVERDADLAGLVLDAGVLAFLYVSVAMR